MEKPQHVVSVRAKPRQHARVVGMLPLVFFLPASPPAAAGRNSGALPAGPAQGSAELVPG